jgi:hypothetical protein
VDDDAIAELGRARKPGVTPEELAEVLWLFRESARWDGGPQPAPARQDGTAGLARAPDLPHGGESPRRPRPGPPPQRPAYPSREQHLALGILVPGSGEDDDAVRPSASPVTIRLADAPALPKSRELARALAPLRYGPRRRSPAGGIDEEATAVHIAQARSHGVTYKATRRRRFDLDLVLDVGGSGPMWVRLAEELADTLRFSGAFRDVRPWVLDTDWDGIPLQPTYDVTRTGDMPRFAASTLCRESRRPLILVVTDGSGRAWQSREVYEPLREWAAHGMLVLAQLLPAYLWNRSALRALPVTFRPMSDGYHRAGKLEVGDSQLAIAGLDRATLGAATAVPVIALDAGGIGSWLELLRGSQAGAVPGFALLMPSAGRPGPTDSDGQGEDETGPEELTGEQRVQRFMLAASEDARRLAQLLSVFSSVTVPAIRKVRHELLPDSEPHILAEVMLGGLLSWTPGPVARSLSGESMLSFHDGVRELLMERPGGVEQFEWDREEVRAALLADAGYGRDYKALLETSGTAKANPGVPSMLRPMLLLPPYPSIWGTKPRTSAGYGPGGADPLPGGDGDGDDTDGDTKPVKVGIWGSTQSGRTVFLAVLCELGRREQWTRWRGDEWRLLPKPGVTEDYIQRIARSLFDTRRFPEGNLPGEAKPLSFDLEQRRPEGLFGWRKAKRKATITMTLEERPGLHYKGNRPVPTAVGYLTRADVLLYFFDPTHDRTARPEEPDSFDYFNGMIVELRRAAARRKDGLRHGVLQQHIAVCIPKLDDQWVFDAARRHGCMELDPETGTYWVPPRLTRRFFEGVTYDLGTISADYLRREISSLFYPKRISYHALSSVGYWAPDGRPKLIDVCNREPVPSAVPADADPATARWRLRGDITQPIHVLDPLITLVERAQAGRR